MNELTTGMQLAAPYGGLLVDLMDSPYDHAKLLEEAITLPSLQLSAQNTAWLGLLATGALSPIDRFMRRVDYVSVCNSLRLVDGTLFPVPIILTAKDVKAPQEGTRVALRDIRNHLLAVLSIEEIFECINQAAPLNDVPIYAISGPLQMLGIPDCLMFPGLRRTPAATRASMAQLDLAQVLAVDDWNSSDEQQSNEIREAAKEFNAALLLNLPALEERLDDFSLFARLKKWDREFQASFGKHAVLNYLNLPNMLNTARALLLRAIIHKNYGAHRYMYNSQSVLWGFHSNDCPPLRSHNELIGAMTEIGIEPVPREQRLTSLKVGFEQPLNEKPQKGFCIWLTGLPGAGKSTIAERLTVRLMERGRVVTLLDGDVVRTHLSRGLSFSHEDRDANVQRIGFVASEIVRHGGIAICAAVSPYRAARERVRRMMPPGTFIEIFVDTPISICEQRDVKGFYAKARKGQMKSFTGVNDPYEPPESPEIRIMTSAATPEEEEQQIIDYLLQNLLRK